MELNKENSEKQAEIIKSILPLIIKLDLKYCKQAAEDMIDRANSQRAMYVLNPSYPEEKNQIIETQASALLNLVAYVEDLQKVEELKLKLNSKIRNLNEINKLFL